MKISIIIPCYNEKKYINKILEKIKSLQNLQKEIILIDDGSDEETKKILKHCLNDSLIDELITLNKNFGKGYAVKTGVKKATGDIILIQDTDLEYNPDDYYKLIDPIISDKADIVYGSRFLGNEKGQRVLYYSHRVGNFFLTTLTNILTNINFTDMETGYKVFKSDVLKKIEINENSFGIEPEITVKLAKMNFRFYEVGISYNGRTYEEGKKIKLKDFFIAIYCLIKYRFF